MSYTQSNMFFLQSIFDNVYHWISSCCRNAKTAFRYRTFDNDTVIGIFKIACCKGDISTVMDICENYDDSRVEEGLVIATECNQRKIVEYLLHTNENGSQYTNCSQSNVANQVILDKLLAIASSRNYYDLSEFLVTKGADPIAGIRESKSHNITSMLYCKANPSLS